MANPDKPATNEADLIEEHLSDNVFPELAYDCFPERTEWLHDPAVIELLCGCQIEVLPGDTVWVVYDEDTGEGCPVAVDPVTIH